MKETTSDTLAPFARQDGQNQPKWFNMTALANNNLSIKSSKGIEMSIEAMKVEGPLHVVCQCDKCKAEKQEQDEPVGKFAKFTDGIWREVADGSAGVPLYTTPQPKQEQGEPVAWRAPNWGHSADDYVYRDFDDPVIGADGNPSPNNEPLYTTPQRRTWVGLTDEEIADCAEKMEASDPTDSFWREFFRGIEAKLKEKNT
jgi:hypothetical protein